MFYCEEYLCTYIYGVITKVEVTVTDPKNIGLHHYQSILLNSTVSQLINFQRKISQLKSNELEKDNMTQFKFQGIYRIS
ncbi:hypothetical protein pb186bvf_010141 [Paramecium bursaria]